MKKILAVSMLVPLFAATSVHAAVLFSDNFNSYTVGNLAGTTANAVGQGTWAQTGATATTPIQVTAGGAVALATGQDVYSPLSIPTTLADGESVYFSFDISVSSATATGDYFLHFTPNAGNSTQFYSRLFARSATGGFELGWLGTSGGAATPTYGTTALLFDTTYQVVMAYNYFSATPTNSTGAIYVDPTDPVLANNTAYVPETLWTASGTTTASTNSIAAVNLRQAAGNAAILTLDNLVVGTAFSDVVIPEPTTAVLVGLGALLLVNNLRRRR